MPSFQPLFSLREGMMLLSCACFLHAVLTFIAPLCPKLNNSIELHNTKRYSILSAY